MDTGSGKGLSTWIEIDLNAIGSNVRQLKQIAKTEVMAVVKANAYGHGLVEVARRALQAGALFCGVARIDEALELRRAGIAAPVLVLGETPVSRYREAIEASVSLTVFDRRQLDDLPGAAARANREARVHLKVDTGMSRLGAPTGEALVLLRHAAELNGVALEGVFTHFARADEAQAATNSKQLERFSRLLEEIGQSHLRPRYVHSANSAAALRLPASRFDLIRPGIALYGLDPSGEVPLPAGFRPALTWKSRIVQTRMLARGAGVSYGHEYVASKDELIGVVPVGYGDGYRREPGNSVLVQGTPVPVLGRVCMDQIIVGLDAVPQAAAGDEVVLLGQQGALQISAGDLADRWGTINYEVVCGLSARVPRLYQGPPPEKNIA